MSLVGQTISHFQVLDRLGEGGMGVVYKCRDARLGRIVALKVLPADKMEDDARRHRFAQEARAASALNHPNIVTIYDIGQADGVYFIAMEYVEGRTLSEIIGRRGLPLRTALTYAVQIAGAVSRAHSAGIVHRDLKPGNVMVTRDGTVKVLDFGLAKLVEPQEIGEAVTLAADGSKAAATAEGKIVGTVAYMSPEQAQGKAVDARSDVFSFGSMVFEMLTGRSPFVGETAMATLAGILNREPPPLEGISAPLPRELERAVGRCLRKDPERRWQTMSDLKVLLEDLKEEASSGTLSASLPKVSKAAGRIWIYVAAGLAAATIALALWLPHKPATRSAFAMDRLTFESGLVGFPVISPDGKLIVYSSDQDGPFNLYVRQVNGSRPVRLTRGEAADWLADFSPDGSRIVFRSERDGGGIYEMDALGGPQEKIADRGWFPRFSPDGSTIAYIVSPAQADSGKLRLVSARGGTSRPFKPDFDVARVGPIHSTPAWSPDGRYLLFDGAREGDPGSRDWWVAPVEGGAASRANAPPMAPGSVIRYVVAWHGKFVYYSEGTTQGGMSIFRVAVSGPPWKVAGTPERITSPLGMQLANSVSADGRLVFSSWTATENLWSFPLDANAGRTLGPGTQLTSDSVVKLSLDASADGSRLAYVAFKDAQHPVEVRVRDVGDGHESVITTSSLNLFALPHLSADGSRLSWRDVVGGKAETFLANPGSMPGKALCEGCEVWGFFPNGREVLAAYHGDLVRQNVETGSRVTILELGNFKLSAAALSPQGRRIAFTVARPDGDAALYMASVGARTAGRDAWVEIAEDRNLLRRPAWSPNGQLIYYFSSHDDFPCLWAQPIGTSGELRGEPVATHHFHRFLRSHFYGGPNFAVTPHRLYVMLAEVKGNAWMVKVGS